MSENKHIYKMPGYSLLLTLPFILILGLLTVVSFIFPLRPTYSAGEKRELTKFPEFSVKALVSGDYFDDITLWFSDTFPGREDWVTLSQYTTNFHGYSEVAFEGEVTMSEQIPLESIPKPTKPEPQKPVNETPVPVETEPETQPQETAPAETVPPETQPKETVPPETQPKETVPPETQPKETVPPETQPKETEPPAPKETVPVPTVPSVPESEGDDEMNISEFALGTAIQIGDTGYNQLGFSKIHSDRYIKAVNTFADAMAEKGVRVISCPAPTSVGVMVAEEYLARMGCAPQDDMLNYLHGSMSDNVVKVDTFSNMVAHNDEYIYFRTDHHWTQLGAYYAYEALCNTLGWEAISLDDCRLWPQGAFTGSLYGKVRWPSRLREDTLDAYVPQGDIEMYCYFRGSTTPKEWPLIDDRTGDDKSSRYSCFLGSDAPMVHVINNDIPDGPNCIVMKDSFGNCFVPFLTQHYSNIYALDYRTYKNMSMSAFVDQYDIDDVIIAPYMIATQSEDGTRMFTRRLQIP